MVSKAFLSTIIKQTTLLILSFIFFTIIGTLSHEYGHILVAQLLGYETELHFASMNYKTNDGSSIPLVNDVLILMGGPVQTFLTALVGLLILRSRKNKIKNKGMQIIDWLAIFLSLFLLRAVFNYAMNIIEINILEEKEFFTGDEAILSEVILGQESHVLPTVSAVISVIGLSWVVFYVLPKRYRIKLMLSGLLGGFLGFLLWMKIVGPQLLP